MRRKKKLRAGERGSGRALERKRVRKGKIKTKREKDRTRKGDLKKRDHESERYTFF